jgi:hypothetical protein
LLCVTCSGPPEGLKLTASDAGVGTVALDALISFGTE